MTLKHFSAQARAIRIHAKLLCHPPARHSKRELEQHLRVGRQCAGRHRREKARRLPMEERLRDQVMAASMLSLYKVSVDFGRSATSGIACGNGINST